MPQILELTRQAIASYLNGEQCLEIKLNNDKYVVFSDIHLGAGGLADDFVHNEILMMTALEYYRVNDFKLILLGDIEDLWQEDLNDIIARYDGTVHKKIREFGDENVYRIIGNHDSRMAELLPAEIDPAFTSQRQTYEAITFIDDTRKIVILLIHGHQGSVESQIFSKFSKFWVWLYGKTLERLLRKLKLTHHNAEPSSSIDDDYDNIMYRAARENNIILICGHSHYATALPKNIKRIESKEIICGKIKMRVIEERGITPEYIPSYFNSGCCLYDNGITLIELDTNIIRSIMVNG